MGSNALLVGLGALLMIHTCRSQPCRHAAAVWQGARGADSPPFSPSHALTCVIFIP